MADIKTKLVELTATERVVVRHALREIVELYERESMYLPYLEHYLFILEKVQWYICEDCHQDTSIEQVHDCPARAVGDVYR
jgi:hypothetical protein